MMDDPSASAERAVSIMTEPTLTPSRLWKRMTADQRSRAARAFWLDEEATDDQMQAVLLIAQQKKFRPKFVLSLDDDRKAKHLAGMCRCPIRWRRARLVVYHLAEQREMMGAFLDALGIAHENGLIQDDDVKPDPEKIQRRRRSTARNVPGRRRVAVSGDARLPGSGDLGGAARPTRSDWRDQTAPSVRRPQHRRHESPHESVRK